MNVLKSTVNNRLLKVLLLRKQQKCLMQISVQTTTDPKPVKVSYATYETTDSTEAPIPPLIVLHGLFGSKSNWNSLCKAMLSRSKPQRKIIAIDARNHGDSPHTPTHGYEEIAADVKHFMEVQKIPKAILMGHSMGGKSMMYFALRYPQFVEKLIIVDIAPITRTPVLSSFYGLMQHMDKLKLTNHVPISTARIEADSILSNVVNDKGVRAFLLTNLIKNADGSFGWRINLPALMSNFPKIQAFPSVGAAKFNGPALFIVGALSDFVQKQDMVATKITFPNAQFISIPGAGHWVHSEKPNEFLGHVLKFINT